MRWVFLVAAAIGSASSTASAAEPTPGGLARTMLVAFQCGQYAGYAKMRTEQQLLYSHGIDAGRQFIKAAREGKLSDKDARENIPMVVGWMVRDGGPSEDFVLGRIFETITAEAADSVMKKDSDGMLLPPEKWRTDDALLQSLARNKYDRANCWAIAGKSK